MALNENVLTQFRSMAAHLKRAKVEITIELKSGTVLKAQYDRLFKSIVLGGITFPASELSQWTKLCWCSEVVKVVEKLENPVSLQEEN